MIASQNLNFLSVIIQVVPDISTHSTRSGQKAIKGSPLKTKSERKRKRKNESDEDIQGDLSKGVCLLFCLTQGYHYEFLSKFKTANLPYL